MQQKEVPMHSEKFVETAKTGYIIMSLLFCIMGVMLICIPDVFLDMIGKLLGGMLILFGLIRLVGYFSKDLFRLTFQYDLALGILLIALGVLMILKADNVVSFISVVHGIYAMADGLLKVQISFDAKDFGVRRWWMILFAAVITGAIGFLLVLRPFDGAALIIILSGISLLAEGILNLVTVMITVRVMKKKRQPEWVE